MNVSKTTQDIIFLTYKGFTQQYICKELNVSIDHVRSVQHRAAANGEIGNNEIKMSIASIRKIECELFKKIDMFHMTGSKDLVLLGEINELKHKYAKSTI